MIVNPYVSLRRFVSAFLLTLNLVAASPARADEAKTLAAVLPDKTPIYLKINQPAKFFLEELRNPVFLNALKLVPNVGNQLEGPQVDQVKAVLGALASTEDLSWTEMVRELLAGPAEVALANNPNKLVLAVTPKDVARLGRIHGKLLEFISQDAKGKGNPDPVKKFQHAGVDCFSLSPQEAHAIAGGRLILASSEQLLSDALDFLTGAKKQEKALTAEPRFIEAAKAATPDTRQAWAFVRMDILRKDNYYTVPDEYNPLAALLFGGWVEAYKQADWLGLALDWQANKPALQAILPVSEKTAQGEIRKAFTPPKGTYAPRAVTVPNQIGTLALWRDLGKVWNVRESVVAGPALQGLNGLDNGLGQFFGGRDFATGVLGSLNADWRLIVAEQDLKSLSPKPDLVLPAFAINVGYDTKDDDFRQRWVIAFQSLIGVLNVVGGQQKAPTLVQNQEEFEGGMIYSARFLPPNKAVKAKDGDKKADEEGVHIRHNFRPTLALVGDQLIIATTTEMARDVIKGIKAAGASDTPPLAMMVDVDGKRLANVVKTNKERLVMQNMVEKGNSRKAAETEIGGLETIIRTLNHAQVTAEDTANLYKLRLSLDLNQAK